MEETLTIQEMLVRGWTKPLIQRWLRQYAANQPIAFPVSAVQEAEQLPPVQMRLEEIRAQRKISPQVFANQPTLGKNLEDLPADTEWTLITSVEVRERGWSKKLIRKCLPPRAYELTPNGPRPRYFLAEVRHYEADPAFQGLLAEMDQIRQKQPENPNPAPNTDTVETDPNCTKGERISLNRQKFVRNKQRAISREEQQDHKHNSLARMMSARPEKGGPLWSS